MDSIRPWFFLKSVPGVGNLLAKRLLDLFETPQNVFQASAEKLLRVEGVTKRHVAALKNHKMPRKVNAELDLLARKDYRITTQADPDYPNEISPLADPYLDVSIGDVITHINGDQTLSRNDLGAFLRNGIASNLPTRTLLARLCNSFRLVSTN